MFGEFDDDIPLQPMGSSEDYGQDERHEDGSRKFRLGDASNLYELNIVRNQKYTLATFLPVVLYEQFRFFFNLYFLLVALSQLIKQLQIGYIFTYFGPLIFVLTVTISKEAHDDYYRFKRDVEANSQMYQRLTEVGLEDVASSRLRVGDFVLIPKNHKVPADCILLRTSDPSGTCFLRTDQLDGETDWKLRISAPTAQKLPSNQALFDEHANVYVEKPTKDIHTFVGKISWDTANGIVVDPLSVENMLWMNTINASDPVLGCVVYTGKDTKAIMNTSFAPTKVGLVDLEINQLTKILAAVTLILSIVMVALQGFNGVWYVYIMRFLILFSSIIPISLRVNLDMGKTVYSYLIMNDEQIKDTIVRTSTIPEELGRIDYLLTDKTGTLTKNEMEMKKLHIGTMSFDSEVMYDLQQQLEKAYLSTDQDTGIAFKRSLGSAGRIKDVVLALALCHNVTPNVESDGTISFQAASPDEIAIVKWTFSMGLKLVHRDIQCIRLEFKNKLYEYQILDVFPFSSETKRMGIIVKETDTGKITFYQKGADSIMAKIVMKSDWLEEECSNMAREGYRTLVIGRKSMSLELYQEFRDQ